MKVILKYLKRTLLFIGIFLFTYFSFAFLLSISSTNPHTTQCEYKNEIFLSTNGVHLDIVIPKNQNDIFIPVLPSHINYIAFGWGDKRFYLETPTWDKLKFSTAAKALFWKSETAMHVTMYQKKRKDWMSIKLCDEQLNKLTAYIKSSFLKNKQGEVIEIKGSGYSNRDRFYEAIGSYDCINTCNSWVNKGLKIADIKTCIWSPFDKGIIYQVEKK